MNFRWKDDRTMLVLKYLKEEECLWNKSCKNYRNKECRDRALENIAIKINLPGLTAEDIKLKIKSIRTRYTAELSKIVKSQKNGASLEDIYQPKLIWFNQADSFLRSNVKPRRSSSRAATTPPPSDENDVLEVNMDQDTGYISPDTQQAAPAPPRQNYLREPILHPEMHQNQQNQEARRQQLPKEAISNSLRPRRRFKRISKDRKSKRDEFDLFGKTIALQLRQMPTFHALFCMQKLQQVIISERVHLMRVAEQHSSSSGSSTCCSS